MILGIALLFAAQSLAAEPIELFRRASEQLALGKEAQALGDFRKALAADPHFTPAQYSLAATHLRLGQVDQALAAASSPNCVDARCTDIVAAATELKQLLEDAAAQDTARSDRRDTGGDDDDDDGGGEEDCAVYRRMLEIAPKSSEILKDQARCQLETGRVIEAIRDLTLAVQIDRADSESAARAAVGSFILLDQRQPAMQILRQCVNYDDNATACKQATKKLRRLQKFLETEPKPKLNAVIKEARALLVEYNIPTKDDRGMLVENLRRERCLVQAERQKWGAAAKTCAIVRDIDPDFPPALLVQAHLELKQNNLQQALELVASIKRECKAAGDPKYARTAALASELHDHILRLQQERRRQQFSQQFRFREQRQGGGGQPPYQAPDKDFYKVLNVDKSADKREIRKAYRELSKKYHPDKYKGKDLDENQVMEKMQEINEAYETLSNEDRRKDYDEQRQFGGGSGGGGGGGFQQGGFQQAGFGGGFPGFGGQKMHVKQGGNTGFMDFNFGNWFT